MSSKTYKAEGDDPMFIGRKNELAILEEMYESGQFQFLTLYGRRRVGKTELLSEFASKHKENTISFSALQKNNALNLEDFSKLLQMHFDHRYIASFPNWEEAFSYYGKKASTDKNVLIIDEFPYLAEPDPSIMSILQHQIDHTWKNSKIMLVLCGSSISYMEKDVIGQSAPLYGRTTRQLELKSFDYLEAAEFFPSYSNENKLIAYGILGGIPRYLIEFETSKSIEKNLEIHLLRNGSFLNDEPQVFLRMETRESAIYNSIITAISEGMNTPTKIGGRIHEDRTKVSKYLLTLQNLRIIEKVVPCGEPDRSKTGIYKLKDNFFKFWYRFEFSNHNYYELLGPESASKEIKKNLPDYIGLIFEDICKEYLVRMAKAGNLPFVPYYLGKWWGNNPYLKAQDDVDVLGLSKDGKQGIFCECKFKNSPFVMEDYEDTLNAVKAFPNVKQYYLYFFSKSGFTDSVRRRAEEEGAILVETDDLFHIGTAKV